MATNKKIAKKEVKITRQKKKREKRRRIFNKKMCDGERKKNK